MSQAALTLYFDGKCPICRAGVARLAGWDARRQLAFVDITSPRFDASVTGVAWDELNRALHARRADGVVLRGTRAILAAYELVGQGWRVAWMCLPFAELAYLIFSSNRYRISRLVGHPKPDCEEGVCSRASHLLR